MTARLMLLALAAAAVIGLFAWRVIPRETPSVPAAVPPAPPVAPTVTFLDPVRGTRNAPHTIIEFGDYACPACAAAETELTSLMSAHPDIRLVWKDFPLPSHPHAQGAAEAAHCAGDQGKYWEFHDLLMANQSRLGEAFYAESAAQLGLGGEAFATCMVSGRHAARVQASFDEGAAAGVDRVPYFFVNGRTFSGAVTGEMLRGALPLP